MTAPFRVFVNERPVDVARGADVRAALAAADPALAAALAAGRAKVTDARGLDVAADVLLAPGAILRVLVRAARSAATADDDDEGVVSDGAS